MATVEKADEGAIVQPSESDGKQNISPVVYTPDIDQTASCRAHVQFEGSIDASKGNPNTGMRGSKLQVNTNTTKDNSSDNLDDITPGPSKNQNWENVSLPAEESEDSSSDKERQELKKKGTMPTKSLKQGKDVFPHKIYRSGTPPKNYSSSDSEMQKMNRHKLPVKVIGDEIENITPIQHTPFGSGLNKLTIISEGSGSSYNETPGSTYERSATSAYDNYEGFLECTNYAKAERIKALVSQHAQHNQEELIKNITAKNFSHFQLNDATVPMPFYARMYIFARKYRSAIDTATQQRPLESEVLREQNLPSNDGTNILVDNDDPVLSPRSILREQGFEGDKPKQAFADKGTIITINKTTITETTATPLEQKEKEDNGLGDNSEEEEEVSYNSECVENERSGSVRFSEQSEIIPPKSGSIFDYMCKPLASEQPQTRLSERKMLQQSIIHRITLCERILQQLQPALFELARLHGFSELASLSSEQNTDIEPYLESAIASLLTHFELDTFPLFERYEWLHVGAVLCTLCAETGLFWPLNIQCSDQERQQHQQLLRVLRRLSGLTPEELGSIVSIVCQ